MYGKSLGLGLVLAACFVVGQGSASGEPYTWSWGPQSVSVEYGTASGAVRTRSDYQSAASDPSTLWSVYLSKTAERDINTSFRVSLGTDYLPGFLTDSGLDQFSFSPFVDIYANPSDSLTYYGTGQVHFQLNINPVEKCQYNFSLVDAYPSNVISQEITFKTLRGTDLGLNGVLSEPGILSGWLTFDVTANSTLPQSAQARPIITLELPATGILLSAPSVPEPAQVTLLGSGALGLAVFGLLRRWRRGPKQS